MTLRNCLTVLAGLALLLTSGCATRYQDLLRDRDLEIRELRGQLSDARSNSAELERQAREAQDRMAELNARPRNASTASGTDAELARVQNDLPDLDVRRKSGRLSIGIDNTITFDSGSVAIKPSADKVLRDVAAVLKREFGGKRIYVEGHTDTDPINKTRDRFRSNLHLSAERAESVASYLVSKCGVPDDTVVVVGYGAHEPRVSGSNSAAKARNRRVEIVVGDAN